MLPAFQTKPIAYLILSAAFRFALGVMSSDGKSAMMSTGVMSRPVRLYLHMHDDHMNTKLGVPTSLGVPRRC